MVLAGLALWWAGCALLAWSWPRRRSALGLAIVGATVMAVGLGVRSARGQEEAFTAATVLLRDAPHGLAEASGTVDAVTLVRVEDRDGGWVRIRDPRGRPGWVPASALAVVRGLD